jgi:hypothetical protein
MTMMRSLFVASIALFTLAGCAETAATATGPTEPIPMAVTRDAAVTVARRDAANHFSLTTLPEHVANRVGSYWVIDLRAPDGGALHYSVALDGLVHERSMTR